MPRNCYPRQCYEMLRQLDEGCRNTWATNLERLLYRYGFWIAWFIQGIENVNVCIAMFKDRLTESFNSNTMSDINTSPKALCYNLFKLALNSELYLSGPQGSWSIHVCCLCWKKMEFRSCAMELQCCGIIHYYWWTASIKPRLLFSGAGYASWGLSLSSV